MNTVMSEYLEGASIHETEEYVVLRWPYEGAEYALTVSRGMLERLEVEEGQKAPVMMKVLVYDKEEDNE